MLGMILILLLLLGSGLFYGENSGNRSFLWWGVVCLGWRIFPLGLLG